MAEISAFNRRHQRHSVEYHNTTDEVALLIGARDRLDEIIHSGSDGIPEAPRSNSKSRHHKPPPISTTSSASSTIVMAVVGSSVSSPPGPGSRKMTGTQLRLFFLCCVALYLLVICFADDIVQFAQWIGDDDDVAAAWKAVVSEPPALPKPSIPSTRKSGAQSLRTKEPGQEEQEGTRNKGNLRGQGEEAKEAREKVPAAERQPEDVLTPAVLVEKEAVDVKEKKEAATMPPEKKAEEEEKNSDHLPRPADVPTDVKEEKRDDTKAQTTTQAKEEPADAVGDRPPKGDERDAPLDSVEEQETSVDKAETLAPVATEALAAPAEIPKTPEQHEATTTAHEPMQEEPQQPETPLPIAVDDGARNPDSARQ